MVSRIQELHTLLRNRYLPQQELRALQERKLRAVLAHAYEHVPYYGTLFRSAGLTPQDVRTLDDLPRVPITTKEAIKAVGLEGALTRGVDPSSCGVSLSSGSTGKPFASYHNARETQTRTLVGFRTLHTAGVRPWDRIVQFLSWSRPPSLMNRLGLYRTFVLPQSLTVDEQIQQLKRIQPSVLRIVPSKLRAIAHQLDYRISAVVRPKILITGSEVLDDGLKKRVLADLDTELFNFYLCTEFADVASDCPAHEGLHVNVDQLILECLDDDGRTAEPGKPGTVVVTSLYGYTMPFIRYRLGDICTPIEGRCSCGSSFPLISAPLGRQDDVLRLPSGKILSTINLGVFMKTVDGVDQFRYTQERLDQFVLQLVVWKHPGEETLAELRRQVFEFLGEPVSFEVQIVDRLPEDKGKFRRFISKVPQSDSTDSQGRKP